MAVSGRALRGRSGKAAQEARGRIAPQIIEPLCAVFRRALKAEGLKYTPERAQVLDTVVRFDGIFEAEQVAEGVRAAGFRVSKATIYRTLRLLLESGILQRVLIDEEQSHFQLVYGRPPLDLLIRTDTGESIAVELPELVRLRERICREHGLVAKSHRLQIFAHAPS